MNAKAWDSLGLSRLFAPFAVYWVYSDGNQCPQESLPPLPSGIRKSCGDRGRAGPLGQPWRPVAGARGHDLEHGMSENRCPLVLSGLLTNSVAKP